MSENKYTNERIEFHILQSFPVTCLNRDDVGAPKTAVVGGVTRARVSSQCWKRSVRMALHDVGGVELGVRTKLIGKLVEDACKELGADDEKAKFCGLSVQHVFSNDEIKKKIDKILNAKTEPELDFSDSEEEIIQLSESDNDSKSATLLFMDKSEIKKIAEAFQKVDFDFQKVYCDPKKGSQRLSKDNFPKIMNKSKSEFALTNELDGLDIALFGRMVAQAPTMDVEAASSFGHAISTHKVTNQIEFFTALDDFSDAQGSAHMGSLEFNAATYYRYVSLDLGQLYETLGSSDEFFPQAIEAFVKALYVAVPSARQTTQAGYCLWDYAKVLVRKGQGVQLSFETPVKPKDGGYLQPSIEEVQKQISRKEKLSGSLFGKIAEFEFGLDENFSIDKLVESLKNSVKA
ncbi:MAG: type I-E CRISPR-associated protein Cas7/Cse4/CasC [Treponema sp.]|nr:type I-E CRISPR-associated protein Cas7/Cse4/CasC [Treponema sp.]